MSVNVKTKKEAYKYAKNAVRTFGDIEPMKRYIQIINIGSDDFDSVFSSEKTPIVVEASDIPSDAWYEIIRMNILRGISTNTLDVESREKWWRECHRRVKVNDSSDCLSFGDSD